MSKIRRVACIGSLKGKNIAGKGKVLGSIPAQVLIFTLASVNQILFYAATEQVFFVFNWKNLLCFH